MKGTIGSGMRNVLALALICCPVLAHGFFFPPPPPPPPPPPSPGLNTGSGSGATVGGTGPTTYNGPTGSSTNSGGMGGGYTPTGSGSGSTSAGGEYSGPSGGGGGQGGEYTGPSGGSGGTTGGGRAPASTAGGAGSQGRGGGTTAGKGKGVAQPWEKIKVEWKSVFLPRVERENYASATVTIEEAMKLLPKDGGWMRDARPTIVLVSDVKNADHDHAVAALDADSNFRIASAFFNCFRVDAAPAAGKTSDVRFSVYGANGALLTEVSAARRFQNPGEVLRRAWQQVAGQDLTVRMPRMDYLVKSRSMIDFRVRLLEAGIVCPDCGEERTDALEEISKLGVGASTCEKEICELRTLPRK